MINYLKSTKKFIPWAISVFVLTILISRTQPQEILFALNKADSIFLIFGFIIFLSVIPVLVYRWKIIINFFNYKIKFSDLLKIFLSNLPVAKISPSNSGAFLKAGQISKIVPLSIGIFITFVEAIFDFVALSILTILGGFIINNNIFIILGFSILLLVIFILISFYKVPFLKNKFKFKNLTFFYNNPKTSLIILFLSFYPWFITILFYKLIFISLNVNVPILSILTLQPFIILFGLLPITFSGIGVRESSMIFFYKSFAESSILLSTGLIFSFSTVFLLSFLCLPFTMLYFKKIEFKNDDI